MYSLVLNTDTLILSIETTIALQVIRYINIIKYLFSFDHTMSLNGDVTAGERPKWWSCRRYWGMQPVVEADFASIAY